MREWMSTLVDEISAWPGVTSHEHRFGGIEFRVGKREIGHAHNFGIVDIPFTVKIREALVRAGRAEPHHWLPDSGWTTVRINERGANGASALLRLSYLRVLAESGDSAASRRAQSELESFRIEPEVLEAAGVTVPATRS